VSTRSHQTVRAAATALATSNSEGGIVFASYFDPGNPVIPFALAQVPSQAGRQNYLCDLGLRRLSDDASACAAAAVILLRLQDTVRARQVWERWQRLEPEAPAVKALQAALGAKSAR
jgi:hypothetical protein